MNKLVLKEDIKLEEKYSVATQGFNTKFYYSVKNKS